MKIKKGWNRIVFIFPSLEIAVKLPIVHLLKAVRGLIEYVSHLSSCNFKRLFRGLRREMALPSDCDEYPYFRSFLFGGIMANWRELLFFLKTKNPFLQPTYFSLCGVVNIQKMGEPCLISRDELQERLYGLTNSANCDDGHHLSNPDNFCFDKGRFRILDYGNRKTQKIITAHGVKIFESFSAKPQ